MREFYIVADFISDASPYGAQYILDVVTDEPHTLLNWIRISPLDEYCENILTIKATEARLDTLLVRELVAPFDLCNIDTATVTRTLQGYAREGPTRDDIRFSIVARCGSEERRLFLPFHAHLNFERLEREAPQIVDLWALYEKIAQQAFDEKSAFWSLPDEVDFARQEQGARLIPVLKSGRYDAGIDLPCEQSSVKCDTSKPYIEEILSQYRGPLKPRSDKRGPSVRLVAPNRDIISHYSDPDYTDEMIMEGVRGRVELDLEVDPDTGSVTAVRSASGSATLINAIKNDLAVWRFKDGTPGLSMGLVNMIFEVDNACP